MKYFEFSLKLKTETEAQNRSFNGLKIFDSFVVWFNSRFKNFKRFGFDTPSGMPRCLTCRSFRGLAKRHAYLLHTCGTIEHVGTHACANCK